MTPAQMALAPPISESFLFLLSQSQQSGPLFVLEAVAMTFAGDGGRVMQEAVEHGRGDHLVPGEDLGPLGVALVAREDDGASFIATRDDFEEETRLSGLQRQKADLVEEEDAGAGIGAQARRLAARFHGLREVRDRGGHRCELHVQALVDGGQPQGHGQVRFAHTGRPEQDDVLGPLHIGAGRKFPQLFLVDRGLKAEVEIVERPSEGEGGRP